MITYQYKARDKYGKLASGVMGADSERAVAVKLGQIGYIPISIFEAKKDSKADKVFFQFKRVGFSDLNMFTRQLYTLQKAGLPLLSSLRALREQTSNLMFKDNIGQIAREVEGGSSFSLALERFPRIFGPIYVNMIKAGEASGRLAENLERLAVLGEHEEKIRMRIQAAMRYPMIVVAAILIGFLILITFVVPRFVNLYSQHQAVLPLPTRILIGVNYAVTHFWWAFILMGVLGIIFLRKFITTQEGALWVDRLKLKIPIFGPLLLHIIMSRFCRMTSTLMHSGVPILQILDLTSEGIGNKVIARTIQTVKDGVNEGRGMSEPMKISGMFPPIVVEMVSVGEATGKTDELLLHISDYYDSQVDYTINNLVSLIEPILILFLGMAVLLMALGIFMPMWNMMNLFKQ